MKWYCLLMCVGLIVVCIGGVHSDDLAHEKEMRQLEIKKLELELKVKNR